MPIALSATSFATYECEEDRELPEAEKPVFHFKLLSFGELCDLEDLLAEMREAESTRDVMVVTIKALHLCLVGWKNFKYADGEFVDFQDQKKSDFPCFSAQVSQELIYGAMEKNNLTEEESKNSNSSPELPKEHSSPDTEDSAQTQATS